MATKKQESPLEADLRAMKEQMAGLKADNERLQALTMQFFTTPPATTPAAAPAQDDNDLPVDLDLTGLPDPATDPEGFQKKLAKRIKKSLKTGLEAVRSSQPNPGVEAAMAQRAAFYEGIWDEFKGAHPQLARFEGELSAVTAQEVAKLAARRVNVDEYIIANPEAFMNTVAAEATKHLTELGVDLTIPEEDPAQQRGQPVQGQPAAVLGQADDDADNSASLEIFGARPKGDVMPKGKGDGEAKPGNLISELREVQAKMGLTGPRVEH